MDIKAKIGLHNEFDIIVKDINTGVIKQKAKAYNILLNQIYNRLCTFDTFFDSIYFGRGTGTIDPTRTTLFSQISGITATNVEVVMDNTNNIYYRKRKIVLAPESYVGETITEVGIYGGSLNSHALIKDSEGNPISIVKTSTDEITIYATVYFQLFPHSSGKIDWISLPNNNALVNYLCQGGSCTGGRLTIGTGRESVASTKTYTGLKNANPSTKLYSFVADVVNKRANTGTYRFGTTEGNCDIYELGMDIYSGTYSTIFRATLPIPGIWDGIDITSEQIGVGDGITNGFNTARNIIRIDKPVNVYVDGILKTKNVDYSITGYKKGLNLLIHNVPILDAQASYNDSAFKTIVAGGSAGTYGWSVNSLVDAPLPQYAIFDFGDNNDVDVSSISTKPYSSSTMPKDFKIEGSNDKVNWVSIYTGQFPQTTNMNTVSFTPSTTKYRYYKLTILTKNDGGSTGCNILAIAMNVTTNQINFVTPPSANSVITCDYSTDCIPKDSNHVLDIGMGIQFGEGV